jgi:hypothetical protein
MSETPRKIKANGHIVQADWNQTDPLQMDYIHNKPEIPEMPDVSTLASKADISVLESDLAKKVNILAKNTSYARLYGQAAGATTTTSYNIGNTVTNCKSGYIPQYSPSNRSSQTPSGVLVSADPSYSYDVVNKRTMDNKVNTVNNKITTLEKRQVKVSRYDYRPGEDTLTFYDASYTSGSSYEGRAYDYYIEISMPESIPNGTELTFNLSFNSTPSLSNSYDYENNYGPCEMVGLLYSSGSSFYPYEYEDGGCLAYCSDYSSGGGYGSEYDTSGSWYFNEVKIQKQDTLYLALVEPNAGITSENEYDFINKYRENISLQYSYFINTDNRGPVHTTELHSDTQTCYSYPVEELTISNLVRCFPEDIAQEWSVSFTAGDSDPLIILPNEVTFEIKIRNESQLITDSKTYPLKWLYAEPIFEANKKYLITFKQIIDTIYGIWTVLE